MRFENYAGDGRHVRHRIDPRRPACASASATTRTAWPKAGRSSSAASASPHARGLVGHSDADVVLHAVTDALLGAAGLGDIGDALPRHRPALTRTPTRGSSSRETLDAAEPGRAGGLSTWT